MITAGYKDGATIKTVTVTLSSAKRNAAQAPQSLHTEKGSLDAFEKQVENKLDSVRYSRREKSSRGQAQPPAATIKICSAHEHYYSKKWKKSTEQTAKQGRKRKRDHDIKQNKGEIEREKKKRQHNKPTRKQQEKKTESTTQERKKSRKFRIGGGCYTSRKQKDSKRSGLTDRRAPSNKFKAWKRKHHKAHKLLGDEDTKQGKHPPHKNKTKRNETHKPKRIDHTSYRNKEKYKERTQAQGKRCSEKTTCTRPHTYPTNEHTHPLITTPRLSRRPPRC